MKILIAAAALLLPGCVNRQVILEKALRVEKVHSVVINVDKSAYNSETAAMLDRIDKELRLCPAYFKCNIGSIQISCKGFAPFVTGFVNPDEPGWPIHLKSRSPVEKLLVWSNDRNLLLHEASHSFEMRMGKTQYGQWFRFYNEFGNGVEKINFGAMLAKMIIPFADNVKPKGYVSLYACTNHFEDFAETHCYIRRNDIEKLKNKDIILYRKCKAVERLTSGGFQ
ncbi:MAG: hypothetical protein PHF37_02370 [Phycisphaerae bacterium]|nr:hypothetical protein [Phycisphaerae bacterium]